MAENNKIPDRTTLRFPFPAEMVRDAAKVRAEYHAERLQWWKEELVKAEEKLRASMELRNQEFTGGSRKVAVFDEERQTRVSECHNKVNSHESELKEFETWVFALNTLAGTGEPVKLSIGDVRYFGLKSDS